MVLTSVGEHGLVAGVLDGEREGPVDVRRWPALPLTGPAINVTGAGDSFVGGCMAGLLQGLPLAGAIDRGLACARASVQSEMPVCPRLSGR